jgi:predicted membrane-bound spermidine synthase
MAVFFLLFLVSGFCSILYEVIWLRLSMAQFGVTTALVSVVLSVFMAGLGLGSWGSGVLLRKYARKISFSALRLYAIAELLTAASAIIVPFELRYGRTLLERADLHSSSAYYLWSAGWLVLTLLPWCLAMGATIPVAMLAIEQTFQKEAPRSFSYLYLANVVGAVLGTIFPLFLIELLGFHRTLVVGALLNTTIAATAIVMGRAPAETDVLASTEVIAEMGKGRESGRERNILWLLFTSGLTALGMEVVWIRQYTPYLGTLVYAFALILGVYLAATSIGSMLYRKWGAQGGIAELAWSLLGLVSLLPMLTADPGIRLWALLRLLFGIAPFAAMLGYLTPLLIDRWSGGSPARAGTAYAVNVVGGILGPLVGGFLLLPRMSERLALFVFSLPWLVYGMYRSLSSVAIHKPLGLRARVAPYLILPLAFAFVFITRDYGDQFKERRVLRDRTATIVALGEGMQKKLLVNGEGITGLTPATKVMAHLPLVFLDHPPQSALDICFGMGTTYRSLLSWDISATAVELVPSVPLMFGYYHADGPELLRSPRSLVVIDDGRRYLERTDRRYDVITIDPPPPVEAAASSLLYSKEFYAIAKQRLSEGGILQQWLPGGDPVVIASVARALKESFAYVRVFGAMEHWGFHFLASDRPIPVRTAQELAQRMPVEGSKDLLEWGPERDTTRQFEAILKNEIPIDRLIGKAPRSPALQDDRPVNEYFVLRRNLVPAPWSQIVWQERSVSSVGDPGQP